MENPLSQFIEDTSLCRYILLDPLVPMGPLSPLHINNLKERFGAKNIIPVLRPEIAYDPSVCPQLVQLAAPGQTASLDILQNSIHWAKKERAFSKRYVCGWLTSPLPTAEFAECLVGIGTKAGKALRLPFISYFEPLRMQLLQESNAICPEWLLSVLKGITTYTYIDVTSQPRTLKPDSVPESPNVEIFITEETGYYQKHAKKIVQLFIAWHDLCESRGISLTNDTLMDVASLFKKGDDAGLSDTEDNFVFALNSLQYGDLMSHSELSRLIQQAVVNKGTLADAFMQTDEAVFLSVNKKEFNHERP